MFILPLAISKKKILVLFEKCRAEGIPATHLSQMEKKNKLQDQQNYPYNLFQTLRIHDG